MATHTKLSYLLTSMVLFASTYVTKEMQQSCPPAALVHPCTCYVAGIVANILCKGIRNQSVLLRVLVKSETYQIKGLDLDESNVSFIPSSIFNADKPIKIYVTNSWLFSLFDQPPLPENNLKILVLNEVQFSKGIQWELFSGLEKLMFFTLLNVFVEEIGKSFVDHAPKSIELLAFYKCSVSRLDDFAFASMANLTELYVQEGNITELKRSMFHTPSKLEKLDFQDQDIGYLPDDIFSEMPNLKKIDLSQNTLVTISEKAFIPVYHNLRIVEVDDNPINCGCKIKWITTIIPAYKWFRIDGMCSKPQKLKERLLSDLKLEDFKDC